MHIKNLGWSGETKSKVLPEGTSFNNLTQEHIKLMINYINIYKRKKQNNSSLYETFRFYHGEEVLYKLGCTPVTANDSMLKLAKI